MFQVKSKRVTKSTRQGEISDSFRVLLVFATTELEGQIRVVELRK